MSVVIRKLLMVVVLAVFVLAGAVFAVSNPDPIVVDVGFARFDEVSMPVAFGAAFMLGWAAGVACAVLGIWRSGREKRRLRRDLANAETALRDARSLPLNDAH